MSSLSVIICDCCQIPLDMKYTTSVGLLTNCDIKKKKNERKNQCSSVRSLLLSPHFDSTRLLNSPNFCSTNQPEAIQWEILVAVLGPILPNARPPRTWFSCARLISASRPMRNDLWPLTCGGRLVWNVCFFKTRSVCLSARDLSSPLLFFSMSSVRIRGVWGEETPSPCMDWL